MNFCNNFCEPLFINQITYICIANKKHLIIGKTGARQRLLLSFLFYPVLISLSEQHEACQ